MEQFQGTKAMAGTHAFDTAALQAYLQQRLPGFAGPLGVEQFAALAEQRLRADGDALGSSR